MRQHRIPILAVVIIVVVIIVVVTILVVIISLNPARPTLLHSIAFSPVLTPALNPTGNQPLQIATNATRFSPLPLAIQLIPAVTTPDQQQEKRHPSREEKRDQSQSWDNIVREGAVGDAQREGGEEGDEGGFAEEWAREGCAGYGMV
jgi:hypothetical protein